MEGSETEPASKRQRRSHHRNQLSAYCYCARCDGKVAQKPRTIDDHRTRYPRLRPIDPEPGPVEGQPVGGIEEPNFEEHQRFSPFPDPDGLPNPLEPAPARYEEPPPGAQTPPSVGVPGSRQDRPNRARGLSGADEDIELMNPDEERESEYPFDRLLDRPRPPQRLNYGPAEDYEHRHDDDELNGGLDDAEFGLPDDDLLAPAPELPEFRFPANFDLEPELEPEPEDDPEDENDAAAYCAAFQEPDIIRNAYIDALIQKNLYGATHRALKHQLKSARRTIASHPDITADDIAKMAQTIRTVERRLGVDSDGMVTTFTLCPTCKRRYSPEYIKEAPSEKCLNDGCDGVLFTIRKLASGSRRRVSSLTYPYASPIAWLRHMLTLAGVPELIQAWRTGEDDKTTNGLTSPISDEQWLHDVDPDRPIGDITEGFGWCSTMAGLQRNWNPVTKTVEDVSMLDPPVRFVSLPFGISLSMNTDWFQATKEGNYSVGACYLVINNLPRHMRFLRENISLAIMMPGPNEPNEYALDQMLDPLIDDLLRLKQGVRMVVRHSDPPRYEETVVHGELSQHIADLIARIKLGGGAGVKSELNFCLYCHTRLSSLSVPDGFFREAFQFRDPTEDLNNAYRWKSTPTEQERRDLFHQTGNRFTALHRLPGWHTSTSSPLDAMHLLYLGAMNWIVKQVIVGPGLLSKPHRSGIDRQDIFNDCLDRMWMPRNYQRLPPKLGQTRVSTKADQWKLASRVIFIPLFLALRDGDTITSMPVPRGTQRSPAFKHQAHRAKLLHQQRRKHYDSIGQPEDCPPIESCFSSRNPQFHYRQVLRFCLATSILDKHTLSPADIEFAQSLLESLCQDYATHNVPLSPNFHYMMHFQESMLKTASVYNTHVWGMERANGIVSRINHNGKSGGILEGTLMRGWWSHVLLQNLIKNLTALPNPTSADQSVIEDLLFALRGGNELAQQRGTLTAFIAQCHSAYTRLHGIQDSTRLSTQSRVVDLEELGLYNDVLQFCTTMWPNAGIFGRGLVETHYLAPVGMVRNHSYVEYNGIRYGSYQHASGKGYCYGYIDGRYPVRIERVLHIKIPGEAQLDCICAFVRPFVAPQVESEFPWDTWAGHLGVASWAYGQLADPMAIPVSRFSGTFALFEVPMTQERYWITVALDNLRPEQDGGDGEGEGGPGGEGDS